MSDTRKELERLVIAGNSPLGQPYVDENNQMHPPKVTEMDPIILLRNLHPSLRAEYARRLAQEKIIKEKDVHEFVKS